MQCLEAWGEKKREVGAYVPRGSVENDNAQCENVDGSALDRPFGMTTVSASGLTWAFDATTSLGVHIVKVLES